MAEEPVDRDIFNINSYPVGRIPGRAGRPKRQGVKRTPTGQISRAGTGDHFVYAISKDRSLRTKIGFSSNFRYRQEAVEREEGQKLFVRALIRCETRSAAYRCEQAIHKHFRDAGRNIKGEWFDVSDGALCEVFHSVAEEFRSEVRAFSMAPVRGYGRGSIWQSFSPLREIIEKHFVPV